MPQYHTEQQFKYLTHLLVVHENLPGTENIQCLMTAPIYVSNTFSVFNQIIQASSTKDTFVKIIHTITFFFSTATNTACNTLN